MLFYTAPQSTLGTICINTVMDAIDVMNVDSDIRLQFSIFILALSITIVQFLSVARGPFVEPWNTRNAHSACKNILSSLRGRMAHKGTWTCL